MSSRVRITVTSAAFLNLCAISLIPILSYDIGGFYGCENSLARGTSLKYSCSGMVVCQWPAHTA